MDSRGSSRSPLGVIYLTLCILALGIVVWAALFGHGRFELAGLIFVVLGLPWSLLVTFLVLAAKSSSAWLLAIGYLASCIVNAWLLFRAK